MEEAQGRGKRPFPGPAAPRRSRSWPNAFDEELQARGERLTTVAQVAERIARSDRTVYRLLKEGIIPTRVDPCGDPRVVESDLEVWLKALPRRKRASIEERVEKRRRLRDSS